MPDQSSKSNKTTAAKTSNIAKADTMTARQDRGWKKADIIAKGVLSLANFCTASGLEHSNQLRMAAYMSDFATRAGAAWTEEAKAKAWADNAKAANARAAVAKAEADAAMARLKANDASADIDADYSIIAYAKEASKIAAEATRLADEAARLANEAAEAAWGEGANAKAQILPVLTNDGEHVILDDQEIKILRALYKHRGKYLGNVEIEENDGPTRNTVSKKLPRLKDAGLVENPPHRKRGVTITMIGVMAIVPFLPKRPAQ